MANRIIQKEQEITNKTHRIDELIYLEEKRLLKFG